METDKQLEELYALIYIGVGVGLRKSRSTFDQVYIRGGLILD